MLLLTKNKRKPKTQQLLVGGSITLCDNHRLDKNKQPELAEDRQAKTSINTTQQKGMPRVKESEHEQPPIQSAVSPQTEDASPSNIPENSATKEANRELPLAAQPPKHALQAPATAASSPPVVDTVAPPCNTAATIPKQHHNKKRSRHVRFHSVELQEYAVTVGDHPLCKGFFPLTLDWSHARPKAFGINDYEAIKERRRSYELWELHMSARERWERLRLVTGMNETTLVHLERIRQHRQ